VKRVFLAAPALLIAVPAAAQTTLNEGMVIPLETAEALTTKKAAKGNPVRLRAAADVSVDGRVVIPRGHPATGEISLARAKGMMGQRGKLAIQPLYLQIGGTTVRLRGVASTTGKVDGGAILGMIVITPGFTGKSATLPEGSKLDAAVMRSVTLPAQPE
jgi:hypothetical protein